MLTDSKQQRLLEELDRSWHEDYNPSLQMVRRPFSSPGYHTTLTNVSHTHPTLAAVVYALGLLDSELPEHVERASDILSKVISLQDQNKENATFGIWSWFMEEPLSMMAPPDWNWADFCGKRLVLAEQRHGHRLTQALRDELHNAVFCACEAIMKRDVGPGYTNIAIMGAFVTLIAGEVYGVKRFADYGLERLRKFHAYTRELGTFQEFNSPTYTVVAIQELSSIHTATRLPEAKQLAEDMLDVAWSMVADHYHVPTGQWSGPHSRSYSTVMTESVRAFLVNAGVESIQLTPEEKLVYNLDWYGNQIQCPEAYLTAFQEVQTGESHQVIHRTAYGDVVNTATTYRDERISIGTFSKDVMWNQRRNLLAYVPNGESFTYIHLRFLHDGYDYSSAVFTSRQDRSEILFGIGFCTDGGDTHPSLDPIQGTIEASDLRLRFELGGSLNGVTAERIAEGQAEAVQVRLGVDMTLQIRSLFTAFDGESPEWAILQKGDQLHVDYVVHAGERKSFDFLHMQQALLLFAMRLAVGEPQALEANAELVPKVAEGAADATDHVYAEFRTQEGSELSVTLPLKPMSKQEMLQSR